MLNSEELSTWYEQVSLSPQARAVIDQVRSSEPARRVGGGRGNVSGRYPSRKMGVTIQFESHRVELAVVYEFEHVPVCLEYYDQPPSFKLNYAGTSGRRIGVFHTPDYFVLRQDCAGWEECKTEEELQKLYQHNPNRYQPGSDGHWCCPPGEKQAQELGLYYHVRSSREINWVFQRNIQFLDDYFRSDSSIVGDGTRERIMALVTAAPGLSLEELFGATHDTVTRDEIYALIAEEKIYVDLHAAPLTEPSKVAVFACQTSGPAPVSRPSPFPSRLGATPCRLSVGCVLTWDGAAWKVVNIGQNGVSLLRDERTLTELPIGMVETLAKEGRLRWSQAPGVDHDNNATLKILSGASDSALRVANQRLELIVGDETALFHKPVSSRTLRRWKAGYRQAQESYDNGFVGLLPHTGRRGNATPRLPAATKALLERVITEDYEASEQKSKFACWIALKLACEQGGLAALSYRTFRLAISHRSSHDRDRKRRGRRAAYTHEPFCWYLEQTTPRHGDRPFEIAHIDHTQLDVELVSSDTGRNLGRPWMSLCTDAFSRRILAIHVTFDPPSYRSCLMVMRECVRRHARLPQIVVVDNGAEFRSTYFETLLARYECTKKTPAYPVVSTSHKI